jgi:hypothetical protein
MSPPSHIPFDRTPEILGDTMGATGGRMKLVFTVALLALSPAAYCQRETVDGLTLKEISATVVRLTWEPVLTAKCGEYITYTVYRGDTEKFDLSLDNQIADGLKATTYVAHEPKAIKPDGWYYQVTATRNEGYCPPIELGSGSILTYPLDFGGTYTVKIGEASKSCLAVSPTVIDCSDLKFHAVIARQFGHEFLIGCMDSDYEGGDWTCVNLRPDSSYDISVHSKAVTVLNSGFYKESTSGNSMGRYMGSITPIFSILSTLN